MKKSGLTFYGFLFLIFTFINAYSQTYTWTEIQPVGNANVDWRSSVMSSDGSKIIVGIGPGRLLMSIDGGSNWKELKPAGPIEGNIDQYWYATSISSDGTCIIAGAYGGRLYISKDGGFVWKETQPAGIKDVNWRSVSMSADGSKIIAGVENGRLYITTDSGTSWNETKPARDSSYNWRSVSMSADGSKIIAGVNGGRLFVSTNSGTTWNETRPAGNFDKNWSKTAISSDGSKLFVANYGGRLFISTNNGTSWTEPRPAGNINLNWQAVSLNSDGTKLICGAAPSGLFISTNGGTNWNQIKTLLTVNWAAASVNSDGSKMIAGVFGGRLFMLQPQLTNPTVTVTSPTGGDVWQAGTQHNITWTSNNISNIKIEYTTDNGNNWLAIVLSTPASSGSYSWNIPYTSSSVCKVRISSVDDVNVNSTSNGFFINLPSTLSLTSPVGGENWPAGSKQSITWTNTDVFNVKIEYTTNNGSTWNTIIASTQASTGSYLWTIPNTPSEQCKVKISDAANAALFKINDGFFSIYAPTITISSPQANDSLMVGSLHDIKWSCSQIPFLKIDFSTNNGTNWSTIVSDLPSESGSYSWTVPDTPSPFCKIRICSSSDSTINSVSNSFSIIIQKTLSITSPTGGEIWQVGSHQDISWTSSNIANLKIELTTNNGTTWSSVIVSTPAEKGSYSWIIPNTPSSQCKIKISSTDNAGIYSISNNFFSISSPMITITSPSQGEKWQFNTKHNITWTCNNISDVKLEYSIDNGKSWSIIIPGIPADSGHYQWTIPNTPSCQCKLKISSTIDSTIFSISNNWFSILKPDTWTEVRPAGNNDKLWCTSSMSSDGNKIIAGETNGLYISKDGGISWNKTNPSENTNSKWQVTSMSSDGTKIIAGSTYGKLYISTNGGSTWKETRPEGDTYSHWCTTSISSDGLLIIAGIDGGKIFISSNSGSTWNETQPAGNKYVRWQTTSINSDGTIIIAGINGGRLYISTNGGINWNETRPNGSIDMKWQTSAISSDGSKIVAGASDGRLFVSTDGGSTWNEIQPMGDIDMNWSASAISSDGSKIISAAYSKGLYISNKSYNNWIETLPTDSSSWNWSTISINSDGSKIIIGANGGRLFSNYVNEVSDVKKQSLPKEYYLSQNYPNPFNPVTVINYQLIKEGNLTLKVYDVLGREVAVLANEFKSAGSYKVKFNASNLTSGIYFYELRVNDYRIIKKLTLLK